MIGEFTNALLDAKGISLDADTGAAGRRGRELSYKARVQKNGVIILSACYMKEMGLEPGQEFEIKMGRKSIKLTAIEPETEERFNDSSDEADEFDDDEIE